MSLSRGGAFPVTRGAGALRATEETEVALSPPIAAVKPGAQALSSSKRADPSLQKLPWLVSRHLNLLGQWIIFSKEVGRLPGTPQITPCNQTPLGRAGLEKLCVMSTLPPLTLSHSGAKPDREQL